jgi:hypothetical protein
VVLKRIGVGARQVGAIKLQFPGTAGPEVCFMQLPPKALTALVSIKAELLSHGSPPRDAATVAGALQIGDSILVDIADPPREQGCLNKGSLVKPKEPKPFTLMRHARRPNAFQRGCQRRAWFTLTY